MKQRTRLLAAVLLLATSVVMVVTTSFAWMVLSEKPEVQGIQIAIAGSHTVLVAPDIADTYDGQEVHYPGTFTDSLNFADFEQYSYLQTVGGLLPVSTADGENWYVPTYYQLEDPQVMSGDAYVGQLRPTTEFIRDHTLTYANLTPDEMDNTCQGNYVYLDFWVVAPVDGYKLRVSTGAEGAGSFAIDLIQPEEVINDGQRSYTFTHINRQAAASMRVGFLIDDNTVVDNSMLAYAHSEGFNESYSSLQGNYNPKGVSALELPSTRFTIYEPNGDLHPTEVKLPNGTKIVDGQYVVTEPLAFGGVASSVIDRVTVQLTNNWTEIDGETRIAQMFRTFMVNRDVTDVTEKSLRQDFYTEWLQYQIYPYVTKGNFVANTETLYQLAQSNKVVRAEDIAQLEQAGATEDVYLTQLTGGVPQRIRMYIWLEGQDVDCISSAATGSFAISIELAGGNED